MSQLHVVTGGAGFLGSNLCRALLNRGDRVIAVDSLISGGIDRIRDLLPRPQFRFIRGDAAAVLRDGGVVPHQERVHAVWALAALASPVQYFKRPLEAAWAGADAQRVTLEFAADHAAIFFYASTSELYGNPDVVPTPETYVGRLDPQSLRAPYDLSKGYGETLAATFHRTVGLDVRVARLFNAYGPGMPPSDGRVVATYLQAAIAGTALPVQGTGMQTRSFCYVDDTVCGILALMDLPVATYTYGGRRPAFINIGNPAEVTMAKLAEYCWRTVRDGNPKIAALPPHPDDPARRCPDITMAREVLRWDPAVELFEGLRRTAEWLRGRS